MNILKDIKRIILLASVVAISFVVTTATAWAQQKPKMATEMPTGITPPAEIQTRLGTLRTKDGFPDAATIEKVYDNLDFQRGVQTILTTKKVARSKRQKV